MLKNSTLLIATRQISVSSLCARRPRPKEEFSNTAMASLRPRKSLEPYDRRWFLTSKSAEPYNIRGGSLKWTKMIKLHRGVQPPGYYDPKTGNFVYVEEMVPEIVMPDLSECKLKPYVPYNVENINEAVFTAKSLFDATYRKRIIQEVKTKKE